MSWIDDLSLNPSTDWSTGTANAVTLGQKVTQRELDLAARLSDNGWQNLTNPIAAWTPGTGDFAPTWRQVGSWVILRGTIARTSTTYASNTTFSSNVFDALPASARPSAQWLQPCTVAATNGARMEMRVGTDGGLSFRNTGASDLAVGAAVGFFTVYIVD